MEAKAVASEQQTVLVAKRDLAEAWSLLERLSVSLRRMGSHYATPSVREPLSPQRRQQMLEELDAFFGPELLGELLHARRLLGEYLSSEEAERISEQLQLWQPKE